jgi:hypothetical protein
MSLVESPHVHVRAFVRAIERGPRRPELEKYLAFYLEMTAPPEIEAVLRAWATHAVAELRVGPFVMNDRAIQASFQLPVWVKDGNGPHADVDIDESQVRSDVIVLGTLRSDGKTHTVGIARSGRTITDRLITICGPHDSTHGNLESFLRHCHNPAQAPSALDPKDLI